MKMKKTLKNLALAGLTLSLIGCGKGPVMNEIKDLTGDGILKKQI